MNWSEEFYYTTKRLISYHCKKYPIYLRDEILAESMLIAWERWIDKGKPIYQGNPDLDKIDFIVSGAYRCISKWSDADLIDIYSVNPNPKYAAVTRMHKLRVNGDYVLFDDNDLMELTGLNQSSLGRSRKRGRKLKIYFVDHKMYRSLKDIQKKNNWTEGKARWKAKKIELEWALSC